MNHPAGTIERLETRVQQSPGAPAFARLADYYRIAGDVDKAISLCETGVRLNPRYATGHLLLGRCYYQKERFEDATREFAAVLAIDGKNIFTLKTMGDIAARGGRREEAERYYREAAIHDPLNPKIREIIRQYEAFFRNRRVAMDPETELLLTGAFSSSGAEEQPVVSAEAAPEPPPSPSLDPAPPPPSPPFPPQPEAVITEPAPVAEAEPAPVAEAEPAPVAEAEPDTEMVDIPDEMQAAREEKTTPQADESAVKTVAQAVPGDAQPAPEVLLPEVDDDLKQLLDTVQTVKIEAKAPPAPEAAGQEPVQAEKTEERPYPAPEAARHESVQAGKIEGKPRPAPEEAVQDSAVVELGNEVELGLTGPVKSAPEEGKRVAAPSATTPAASAAPAAPAARTPPAPPAEDENEKTRVVSNVATESLAEIYLRQGYKEQALAVYKKMLLKKPDKEKIRSKIKKLEEEIGRSYGGKKEGKKRNG